MASRPNIVFLIADDHRGTELGHLGGQASTPHLDALAARGSSFRAGALPGRDARRDLRAEPVERADRPQHLHRRGRSHRRRLPAARTRSRTTSKPSRRRCERPGYRTHAVGKWHNDVASFRRSFADRRCPDVRRHERPLPCPGPGVGRRPRRRARSAGSRPAARGPSRDDVDPATVRSRPLLDQPLRRCRDPVPGGRPRRRSVPALCRLYRATRPAHPAARLGGRPGHGRAAAEPAAGAPVRQRRPARPGRVARPLPARSRGGPAAHCRLLRDDRPPRRSASGGSWRRSTGSA